MARPIIDLTGQRFGRLEVVGLAAEQETGRHARWLCLCDCGNTTVVASGHLRKERKPTRSCGCLNRDIVSAGAFGMKHGGCGTPEYGAWRGLISRCENASEKSYKNYGGRGITVAAEWRHDFPAFLAHVGQRPSPLHSIDRIDNDGDYQPGNVRWATRDIQNANRRPRRKLARA